MMRRLNRRLLLYYQDWIGAHCLSLGVNIEVFDVRDSRDFAHAREDVAHAGRSDACRIRRRLLCLRYDRHRASRVLQVARPLTMRKSNTVSFAAAIQTTASSCVTLLPRFGKRRPRDRIDVAEILRCHSQDNEFPTLNVYSGASNGCASRLGF